MKSKLTALPWKIIVLGSLICVLAAAETARAADALEGEKVAKRWCVSCHAVSSKTGTDSGPAFSAIAKRPVFEPEQLRLFLTQPHPPMPALDLTRFEIDNLIAYLQTLRTKE